MATYRDYLDFLKFPSITELKNTTDKEGATPLHRALERKDKLLAKALLIDPEVERNIKDNTGKSAMDLLAKLWKEGDDWVCSTSSLFLFESMFSIYYSGWNLLLHLHRPLFINKYYCFTFYSLCIRKCIVK